MRVSGAFVRNNLICEFDHWDICIYGLVQHGGERWFCRVVDVPEDDLEGSEYTIHPVDWDSECEEYLADYSFAYRHWWYEDGVRCEALPGGIKWFSEKWKNRNPIAEAVKDE